MKCSKCNSEVPEKSKFCVSCGYNVGEDIAKEKQKKKEIREKKFYKVKVKVALALLIIFLVLIAILVVLSVQGEKSHKTEEYAQLEVTSQDEESEEDLAYGGMDLDDEELTADNKLLDYDNDGLTNDEEVYYGTKMRNSDTDGDGLSDYDEINKYGSDPTQYSTSGDGISDYIKVERNLVVTKEYSTSSIKPENVEVNSYITLIPADLESQYYGGIEEYSTDSTVNSTFSVFDVLNFTGTIEYNTNNSDSILLLRQGKKYSEFENYKNENGLLTITITEDDNYKDFVITTKANYESYQNSN